MLNKCQENIKIIDNYFAPIKRSLSLPDLIGKLKEMKRSRPMPLSEDLLKEFKPLTVNILFLSQKEYFSNLEETSGKLLKGMFCGLKLFPY